MQPKILYFGTSEKKAHLGEIFGNDMPTKWLIAGSQDNAINLAGTEKLAVVVVDCDQQELHLCEFVSALRKTLSSAKVIGVTGAGRVSLAVNAVKAGVDELVDVSEEPDEFRAKLLHFLQPHRNGAISAKSELHELQRQRYDFSSIIYSSREMQRIIKMMSRIIERKWVTVLLRGETGTGKELLARAIHYNSFQDFQPFVEINCTTLPESLLESELFGHEKGAFTDAKSSKRGLFELAHNGTLFLDEIGEITLGTQVKLLKALEEKKIRRVGAVEEIKINTRIIAATNRDLSTAIHQGAFRNDLYYRLNVVSITLPPLRDRGDDVIRLADHFLQAFTAEYESPIKGFTPEAEALLGDYSWPGNIRELKHTIERIVLLSDDNIVTKMNLGEAIESETPLALAQKKSSAKLQITIPEDGLSLADGEKMLIQAVLEHLNWNKRKTSQILRISRPRLDRKIQKYGLAGLMS